MSRDHPPRQAAPIRIAALASHPVVYQSPLYRLVAADPRVELTVIFASNAGIRPYQDRGFGGQIVQWESDPLADYAHVFLRNANRNSLDGFFSLADWDVLTEITPLRYDVLWVHSYSYLTLWLGIAAAKVRGMPVMIREEQTLLHGRPWWKASVRAMILRRLFYGVRGLAIGSNNREYFRRYGVPDDRIHLVHYATDNVAWQREVQRLRPCRDSIRVSFGIGDRSPVILFVGKLQPKKQPGLLLEAYRRVRAQYPCALLFVGAGSLEAQLRDRIAEQSIPDVFFAGFLNRLEISRAYAAADIFVLPSSSNETWGMVVNEAMNFGLPVIVSDKVGCSPDLVQAGDNGYIFDHRSTQELADALAMLVSDQRRRRRYGRQSLERIRRWSPDLAAAGLVSAAIAALDEHRSRSARAWMRNLVLM
jgi:glycosyltransferase involved in cell wall biosynthesis